ncbi:MAG: hypothetical protein JO246_10005 [Frankiaceae bacterium]|nr:hypothetical protein [Frankiaceae bacterium]MBV9872869.1 hypothetical protein [Frankiaceae bacterium]
MARLRTATVSLLLALPLTALSIEPTGHAAAGPDKAGRGLNSEIYQLSVTPKSTDAWALAFNYRPGSSSVGDVIRRYHHGTWSKERITGVPKTGVYLNGIAGATATTAWVAGDTYDTTTTTYHPLLARWKSGVFRRMPVPGFTHGRLIDIAASSKRNAWLVGSPGDFTPNVAFRWNGHKWKDTKLPQSSAAEFGAASIATSGPKNTWIAEQGNTSTVQHWNGSKWAEVRLPTEVVAESVATTPTHTWVAGYRNGTTATPVVLRLAGSTWKSIKLKHLDGATPGMFLGIGASGSHAYAVGRTSLVGVGEAVAIAAVLHGKSGTAVRPISVPKYTALNDVAASRKLVLAGGDYAKKGSCQSPFHSIAERFRHGEWSRVAIPKKLVPASKGGPVACG